MSRRCPPALLRAVPTQAPLLRRMEQPPQAPPRSLRCPGPSPLLLPFPQQTGPRTASLSLRSLARPRRRAEAFPAPRPSASPCSMPSRAHLPRPAASPARVPLPFDGFPAKIVPLCRLRQLRQAPSSPTSRREPTDAAPRRSLTQHLPPSSAPFKHSDNRCQSIANLLGRAISWSDVRAAPSRLHRLSPQAAAPLRAEPPPVLTGAASLHHFF
jgi:hypothetical protein